MVAILQSGGMAAVRSLHLVGCDAVDENAIWRLKELVADVRAEDSPSSGAVIGLRKYTVSLVQTDLICFQKLIRNHSWVMRD